MIQSAIIMPDVPSLAFNAQHVVLLTTDGEIKTLPHDQAALLFANQAVLCCHAPYTRTRLNIPDLQALDVLELFAFIHPGVFCVPTIAGLCAALDIDHPTDIEDQAFILPSIVQKLLQHAQVDAHDARAPMAPIAAAMAQQGRGWGWAPFICEAIGAAYDASLPVDIKPLLKILKNLEEWEEAPPKPPHSHHNVSADDASQRLADLLAPTSHNEVRPQQNDYARFISHAFDTPKADDEGAPHLLMAEAGTGTGKTLGYLSPASLWAEKNDAPVWISTYTKNLQRQIEGELDKLYPHKADKDQYVAVRKGRENYLCLLNLQEAISAIPTALNPQHIISAGIMLRWAATCGDGDLSGASFPGWLVGVLGYAGSKGLADQRGECIHAACDHYKTCFPEHSIRRAKDARLVIANHALVMVQSAMAGSMERLPDRYIFDEGHHLFSAADSAFAIHFTAREARDLRRWILGPEGGRRAGRARGLKRRIEDLCENDSDLMARLEDILEAASALPAEGWSRRFKSDNPNGAIENLLYQIMRQVYARCDADRAPYSLETGLDPVDSSLREASKEALNSLQNLIKPMKDIMQHFIDILQHDGLDGDTILSADTRKRIEAVISALEYRGMHILQSWSIMLQNINTPDPQRIVSDQFTDWLQITRIDGQAVDVGMMRHWIDPTKAFADVLRPQAHGLAITSATLRDNETQDDWQSAIALSGGAHFQTDPMLFSTPSSFDYAAQSRVIVIQDVNKQSLQSVSNGFFNLFMAAGGSGLGLFTAISRLRAVHNILHPTLDAQHINLYAQHVDDIDTGTLIDMFRFDESSCLLGTDATRDGVDVPGDSLKLLIFDRVPWPRPDWLHKSRRDYFGGRRYDEQLTRMKLKQAFGRLIRRQSDKGVFVMLDSALPSRLYDAFPADVTIDKMGLADACDFIKGFYD